MHARGDAWALRSARIVCRVGRCRVRVAQRTRSPFAASATGWRVCVRPPKSSSFAPWVYKGAGRNDGDRWCRRCRWCVCVRCGEVRGEMRGEMRGDMACIPCRRRCRMRCPRRGPCWPRGCSRGREARAYSRPRMIHRLRHEITAASARRRDHSASARQRPFRAQRNGAWGGEGVRKCVQRGRGRVGVGIWARSVRAASARAHGHMGACAYTR